MKTARSTRRREAAQHNYEGSPLATRNAALALGKSLGAYRKGEHPDYETPRAERLTTAADLCDNTPAAKAQINANREAYLVHPFFPGEPPITLAVHDIAVTQPKGNLRLIFLNRGDVLVPADTLVLWQ